MTSSEKIDEKVSDSTLKVYYASEFPSCQKVLLALYAKQLDFEEKIIDVCRGENLDPEYLAISPKGNVPVFLHQEKIFSGSDEIMRYLDKHFWNDTLYLSEDKEHENVKSCLEKLEGIPLEVIMYGCLQYPKLTENLKISPVERESKLCMMRKRTAMLDDLMEKSPSYADNYRAIKIEVASCVKSYNNEEKIGEALDTVEVVLDEIEKQLELNAENAWLYGKDFTAADISLIVLLHSFDDLGLSSRFWKNAKRPNLEKYYERAQKCKPYEKVFGSEASGNDNERIPYLPLFIVLAIILFAITFACAYLKYH